VSVKRTHSPISLHRVTSYCWSHKTRSLFETTILNWAIVLRMTTFAGYFGCMSIQVGRIGFSKSQLFLWSLSLLGRPSKPQNPRMVRNHGLYNLVTGNGKMVKKGKFSSAVRSLGVTGAACGPRM
jgi:hypothetical protein